MVVARLVRFEYQEVDKREVVQVGSQDEREAEQSRGTPMAEEQTKLRERRECGHASPCLKDKLVLTPYGVLGGTTHRNRADRTGCHGTHIGSGHRDS